MVLTNYDHTEAKRVYVEKDPAGAAATIAQQQKFEKVYKPV